MSTVSPFPPYGYMPDQKVENYDEEFYAQNLRFIAAQWNFNVMMANQWSISLDELGLPLGFSQRAFLWRDYYFGVAKNVAYDHILMNETGNRKALKMFQGKDIMKYVNYALEPVMDMAQRIPEIISVECVSETLVSRKRLLQNLQKFAIEQKEMMFYMNKAFGAYFQTNSGKVFMGAQAEQMGTVDFRDEMELGATNVAKDIYYRNNMREMIIDWGKDASCTGACVAKVKTVNGYTQVSRVPIWEAIFPPNTQGDQHRTDAYAGQLRFMTVPDIFATYPELTDIQKTDIQSIAHNGNGYQGWTAYNLAGNFWWWGIRDGVPRVAVIEGQWASYAPDQRGYHQTLREGVLIGNKYLIREGISTNQTKDWKNPSDTSLDYITCQPMSMFGRNMGIPEMLYSYQNQVDFLQTKINEWVAQTKGSFYFILAENLPPGMDANQLMAQISDTRLAVIKGVDIDAGKLEKFLSQGAIEMPRDTAILIQQISNYKQVMADILNIPDAARGQLSGYQATKTLNAQLSQSNKGTRYFYDPLNIFYQRVFQKSVDNFKTSTMSNVDFEYTLIISDTQVEMFKATSEYGLSQQALTLGFDDLMDDASKQRMADAVFAFAQNSQVTGYYLSDYYMIESLTTHSEILNFLRYRESQISEQKAKEALDAQKMQMTQLATNSQTQLAIVDKQNEALDKRKAAEIASKEGIEGAKMGVDLLLNHPELNPAVQQPQPPQ